MKFVSFAMITLAELETLSHDVVGNRICLLPCLHPSSSRSKYWLTMTQRHVSASVLHTVLELSRKCVDVAGVQLASRR